MAVATWAEADVPAVEDVERWAGNDGWWADVSTVQPIKDILAQGPLTLSQTLYDERGRPYEQRTYNVGDDTGGTYQFTRTYRDDLDRVTAELGPNGLVTNEYDSLGRVVSTSVWTQQDSLEPWKGAGVELTRTETEYDAFGNVLVQKHYDRFDTSGTGEVDASNAVVTYTYNWYDNAKRLMATAYYGTNGTHGFAYGDTGLDPNVDPTTSPPVWAGTKYSIGADDDVTDDALVTRYGYDRAGRRIWAQDANGVVTRTWHDLLGRTLLEAENWKDFGGNSGPADAAGQPTDLTPNHGGAIRYTAYHYTRGGLLDMMAAVIPPDPSTLLDLTPEQIDWNDNDPTNDFAAGIRSAFRGRASRPRGSGTGRTKPASATWWPSGSMRAPAAR